MSLILRPVPEAAVSVGAWFRAATAFLRSQMDQAIDALVAMNNCCLLEKHGYQGIAGE